LLAARVAAKGSQWNSRKKTGGLSMAGNLEEPIGGKRICYGCGSSYPDSFRFCPKDSTDLEYLPQSLDSIPRGFRPHTGPVLKASIKIIAAILLIAIGFLLNSVVRSFAPDVADLGDLTIRTTPAGAKVYLDGSQVGISPVRLVDIPTGVHEVRAEFPGYRDGKAHVEIMPSTNQKLSWDLSPLPSHLGYTNKEKFVSEFRTFPLRPPDSGLLPDTRFSIREDPN
jgi:hypothetical protein